MVVRHSVYISGVKGAKATMEKVEMVSVVEVVEKKDRNPVVTVRFGSVEEVKQIEEFAASVYGIDRSELVRLSVNYIMKNQPVIGKSYAPGGETAAMRN